MDSDEPQKEWRALVQLKDASQLFAPISDSLKIKYTCIAASPSHVILGANSGGVYCFTADELKFIRLIANREGGVSLLSFSPPTDGLLAAVVGGSVCFWEHNLDNVNEAKRCHVSSILHGSTITHMVWDWRGTRLFYGDDLGRVAIAYVPKLARRFGGASLFKKLDEIIHVEKSSPIVQMDIWQDYLLLSTTQRCCLLKLQGESIEAIIQVGHRPRVGPYGGLFHPRWENGSPVVYSSRPRGRLWEANIKGDVVTTIRNGDMTTPPSTIIDIKSSDMPEPPPTKSSVFNFHQLALLSKDYLVTWRDNGFYIFHSIIYSTSNWSESFNNISNIVCTNDTIYILYNGCQSICCLEHLTITGLIEAVSNRKNWPLIDNILTRYIDVVKNEMVANDVFINVVLDVVKSLKKELMSSSAIDEIVGMIKDKGMDVNDVDDNSHMNGDIVETDGPVEQDNSQANNGPSVVEEDNQFLMDGGDNHTHTSSPDKSMNEFSDVSVTAISEKSFLSHSYPLMQSHPQLDHHHPIQHSFQDHPHKTEDITQSTVSPATSISPTDAPIMIRMGPKIMDDQDTDVVVVRGSSKEKKKKSKSKKRRGSLDSTKPLVSAKGTNLEDIFEDVDIATTGGMSPSYSAATSLDNSPHTSLPPSPPKLETASDNMGRSPVAIDTILEGIPRVLRSQSADDVPKFKGDADNEGTYRKPKQLLSKVKSMASSSSQEGILKVKEIFSSLSPTPIATPQQPSPTPMSPSPEIGEQPTPPLNENTLSFIKSTSTAIESLEMPQVICSHKLMAQSLQEWREELHKYHTYLSLSSTSSDVFSHHDYTSIDASVREDVSDMITMCLEMECMREEESIHQFILDHHEILSIDRTKRYLQDKPLEISCREWRALVHHQCLSDPSQEKIELTMRRLYESNEASFVSFCVDNYPFIEPWEVAAVCHMDGDIPDIRDPSTYSQYLNDLFKVHHINTNAFVSNGELLVESITCLLSFPPDSESIIDEHGQPLVHSHLIEWPYQTGLTSLTAFCKELLGGREDKILHIQEIYKTNGFWIGYLEICLLLKKDTEVFQILSKLQNSSLFHKTINRSCFRATSISWHRFVSLLLSTDMSVERSHDERNVSETMEDELTWEDVVKEMVKHIGIKEAMSVLESIDLPMALNGILHDLLINVTSITRQQKVIAHNLLETLDHYLWKPRPASMGPSLLTVYQKEEEGLEAKVDEATPPEVMSPSPEAQPAIDDLFMEDSNSHWGLRSNTIKCASCDQSILLKSTSKEQGGVAFQCGHVYHRYCLPEQACIICFIVNYKNYITNDFAKCKR
jgi:hypothetical protein